ncbi:MAG: LysR family transcriptional regulator [Pseudomonadota bacterium]
MEWDDLKYVLAAARSGSFLGAAHLLQVQQTTVGRRIKALETDLGHALFERSRDGCVPTRVCQDILPAAEAMEAKVQEITLTSLRTQARPEGLVRIHTAGWILDQVLIPALPEFLKKYPNVQTFFVADVTDTVTDESVASCALRFDVMAKRNEIEAEIVDIPFSVYLPRDVNEEGLRWVSNHGGNVKLRTLGWLEGQGVLREDINCFANDALLLCSAIRRGIGQGLIPDFPRRQYSEIKRRNDGPPDLIRKLRSIVPRRHVTRPEMQAVLGWLNTTLVGRFGPQRASQQTRYSRS